MCVERLISHQTDDDASRQLTGKQFLVTDVSKTGRHGKRLTHDASNWIFCRTAFQSLGVCQEHRRRQLDVFHEHGGLRDHHSAIGIGHDAEDVLAMYQLYLDVDCVQHVTILEENVGM